MPKIKNYDLKEGQVKILKKIVEGLRGRELKQLAELFSISDTGDTEQLKQKISAKLDKDIELTPEQIDFFYKHAPNRKLFDFLPVELLREYSSEIANEIGIDEFGLLILLSDKTDELKAQIDTLRLLDDERKTAFKQEFTRVLKQNVCAPLHIDITDTGANVTRLRAENIELAGQVKDLNRTIVEIREKHQEEINSKLDEIQRLNNRITELNNEIENLKRQKNNLELQLKGLQEELKNLRTQFETRVKEETEKRFSEDLRAWFPQASQVERSTIEVSDDILKFAEKALELQKDRDRNFGNRRTLLQRLNNLEKIRAELVDALENAINPVPEIRTAISRIDDEINRVRSTLGMNAESDRLHGMMLALANTITDIDEYDRLLKFAEFLTEKQVINGEFLRKIWNVVYGHYNIDVQLQPMPESSRSYGLRKKLKDNLECIVMLDAHNIILHDMLKRLLFAPVQEQSRNNLLQLIKALAVGRDKVKFTVVFDGSYPHEENVAPNVRIVFSGGEGEHRADYRIVELVRSNPGTDIFVVTDDEQLIKDIKSFGAQPIRVITFICILQEFGALPQTFLG